MESMCLKEKPVSKTIGTYTLSNTLSSWLVHAMEPYAGLFCPGALAGDVSQERW